MAFSRYLDPRNDIAFKKIFGSEKNKDILIHFLNDILRSFEEFSFFRSKNNLFFYTTHLFSGGATGGCLVAPVIHEKTNNALIQQVQNFKAKEEVFKKAN